MKEIALTGVSGSMGYATFLELLKKKDICTLSVLVRPSKKNMKKFKAYVSTTIKMAEIKTGFVTEFNGVKIVWGDIRNVENVRELIKNSELIMVTSKN